VEVNAGGANFELAEIPTKYRDKPFWVCLRFGFDASGFDDDGAEDEIVLLFGTWFVIKVLVWEHRHMKVCELYSAVVVCAVGWNRLQMEYNTSDWVSSAGVFAR